jgi:hypothetical protein
MIGKCFTTHVCHAIDLPFFWRPLLVALTPEDLKASALKIKYWMDFIDGSLEFSRNWPFIKKDKSEVLDLSTKATINANFRNGKCELWVMFHC